MVKALSLTSPQSSEEWQAYYQLRWQVLRAPWLQPPGSEQDELEPSSFHQMLVDPQGHIAAVGRLHQIDNNTAQVRYMAVSEPWQGQGAGSRILQALEQQAVTQGMKDIVLNARDSALSFYQRHGYFVVAAAPSQFGIVHHRMQKPLCLAGSAAEWQQWCQSLQQTWHRTIPLSAFMQLRIEQCNGYQLQCTAPLSPNINLHQTMFAGSIYTLATLTGWGMLYLQLQSLGLHGAQVLADANIRYLKPIRSQPTAICKLAAVRGDLKPLAAGKRVKQQISVQLFVDGDLCAEFSGLYAVLPE